MAITSSAPLDDFPTGILYVLGGLGPTVSWVACNILDGKKGTLETIFNALRFDSLGLKGLTITACLAVIPMALSWAAVKEGTTLDFSVVTSIIPVVMLTVVSVIEETGWRGYAYPQLNQTYSPLVSSLIVGILWSLWHLPLTMINGTYQNGLGTGSPEFYLFFFMMIPNSLIYGWLQNYNNQKVASSVLYHTLNNITGEVFSFSGKSDIARTAVITLLALILGIKLV